MQATLGITAERVGLTKDCFQTPDYAAEIILPLLERKWVIGVPVRTISGGIGNNGYC